MLRLRQALGEQVNQVRGVPELFGQRGDGMFPYGSDPMHVPGRSGEYSVDVFAKSKKWLRSPPVQDTGKWSSRELEILGWQTYVSDLTAWAIKIWSGDRTSTSGPERPQQCTKGEEQTAHGDSQECTQRTPQDSNFNQCILRRGQPVKLRSWSKPGCADFKWV